MMSRGDADRAARRADPGDFFEIFVARVGAAAWRAGSRVEPDCTGKMNVIAKRGRASMASTISRVKSLGCEVVKRTRRMPFDRGDRHAASPTKLNLRGAGIAIGIDGLAEQLDFGVARRRQGVATSASTGLAGAAALRPARVRHNAVGAGVVAALDDREVGAEGIIAARDFRFEGFVRVEIEAHHAAPAGFELRREVRKLAIAGRAADQADPRRALENVFAFLLREAAEHADDFRSACRAATIRRAARKLFARLFRGCCRCCKASNPLRRCSAAVR